MSPSVPIITQTIEPEVQLSAKHTILTRMLHWLNMVAIIVLIGSGFAMLIGGDWLKAIGGSVHEVFYFLLFGVAFVFSISLFTRNDRKIFIPTRATVDDALSVVKSELHHGVHKPRLDKYNGAQRIAYLSVLLMVAMEIVTGLAMAYRDQLPWLNMLLGGRHTVRGIHKLMMFGIVAFVVVHVVQVVRSGWPSLRSMISGYDMACFIIFRSRILAQYAYPKSGTARLAAS